jgi:hypothetical protein
MPNTLRKFEVGSYLGKTRKIRLANKKLARTVESTIKVVRRFTAHHRRLTCLLAAFVPLVLRLSLLPYMPIPEPEGFHDEFSYLLGADTFASGRLTNPPHPMWVHFETIHVNFLPTYATKYPPGQPLFLALGQKVFGHPWYGVLISVSLMSACVCWMLQGWLPPLYASLGTLFLIAQFGVIGYWVNSYWGGALPAAGGALVLGALPRLVRRASMSESILAAFGVVLLANTRPYEGLIVTVASALALVWWRRWERRPLGPLFTGPVVMPAVIILCLASAWMGYYNYRVTGKPWLMPYSINQRMYAASSQFYLLPAGPPPIYRHEVLRKFWLEWNYGYYLKARANPLRVLRRFAEIMTDDFYVSQLLGFAVLIAVFLAPSRKVRIALAVASVLAFGLLLEIGLLPHYYAPAAGLILVLVMSGVRYLCLFPREGRAIGSFILLLFASAFFIPFASRVVDHIRNPPPEQKFMLQRREIISRLMQQGSRHLVIVHYAPDHVVNWEWVYNRADIDGSAIVWAHDMGEVMNPELRDYYRDRKVWLLEPDKNPMVLKPYPGS